MLKKTLLILGFIACAHVGLQATEEQNVTYPIELVTNEESGVSLLNEEGKGKNDSEPGLFVCNENGEECEKSEKKNEKQEHLCLEDKVDDQSFLAACKHCDRKKH